MSKLQKIIDEIESTGEKYRNTNNEEQKQKYERYIGMVIKNHADSPHYNDLCYYWERLKK